MTVVGELEVMVAANNAHMAEKKVDADKITALTSQVTAITAERDTAIKALADVGKASNDAKIEHIAALKSAGKTLAEEQAAHGLAKTELETAKKALSNPAFAAAAAVGGKKAMEEGHSEAGTENKITKENAEAEYKKIPSENAQERADFRAKYALELGLKR